MEQPNSEPEEKAKIEAIAQAILDARNNHPDCSLADLYDETLMPPDLRKAHQANDKAVSNMDVANAAIAGSNGAVNGSLRAFCKKHFRKRMRSFLDEYIQRSDRKNGNKMTQVLLVKKQSEIL